jgi:5-hydroxyisourate hydrolase
MPAEAAAPTGRLTTHVLDTARGRPAAGLAVALHAVEGDARRLIRTAVTNQDGRCDGPLLAGTEMRAGVYELTFEVGPYFRAAGTSLAEPLFLDSVPIRFGVADAAAHYHVPLLISPFGYSTYRGS